MSTHTIPEQTEFFATLSDGTTVYHPCEGIEIEFNDYHLENGLLKLIMIREIEGSEETSYTEVAKIRNVEHINDWNWFCMGEKPIAETKIIKSTFENTLIHMLVQTVFATGTVSFVIMNVCPYTHTVGYCRTFNTLKAAQEAF